MLQTCQVKNRNPEQKIKQNVSVVREKKKQTCLDRKSNKHLKEEVVINSQTLYTGQVRRIQIWDLALVAKT